MSTLDSYSPLGCWLLLVYHLKYQMTSLIRMFPEMGVPPSHHGFKNPKIPSHGHHSDDLGYPHDFTKKKHFGVSEHGYIPICFHGDFCGFPPAPGHPHLLSSDPGRESWVPGPSWPRPPGLPPKVWGFPPSESIKHGGIRWRMDLKKMDPWGSMDFLMDWWTDLRDSLRKSWFQEEKLSHLQQFWNIEIWLWNVETQKMYNNWLTWWIVQL